MTDPYRPIACGLHDELQLRALRRSRVTLRYRLPDDVAPGAAGGEGAEVRVVTDRVVDVRTRSGAEYLALASGEEIRLDRLVEVDGIPFGDAY